MKFYLRAAEEFIPAQPVLYMRRTGAYGSENRVLMERLKAWLSARGLLGPDAVIAAVPLDDPARTKAAQCRYDVCAVCAPGQAAPADPVRVRTLDGGRYVVFLLDHTAEAIQRGWAECFGELERLGFSPDSARPVMERYAKALVDRQLCELCVPVL